LPGVLFSQMGTNSPPIGNVGVNLISSPGGGTEISSPNGVGINEVAPLGADLGVRGGIAGGAIIAGNATFTNLDIQSLTLNGQPVSFTFNTNVTYTQLQAQGFPDPAINQVYTPFGNTGAYTNAVNGVEIVHFSQFLIGPPLNAWVITTNLPLFEVDFENQNRMVSETPVPYYLNYGPSPLGTWIGGTYEWVLSNGQTVTITPSGNGGTITPYNAVTVPLGLTTNITLSGGFTEYFTNGLLKAYH
jgi:hypothetical protein